MATVIEMTQIKGKVPAHVADWVRDEADARMIGEDRIITDALLAFVAVIPGGPEVPMGTPSTTNGKAPAPAAKNTKAPSPVTEPVTTAGK